MDSGFNQCIKASFGLWLDNLLIQKGNGFKTETANLVKVTSDLSGFDVFRSRRGQWVYDDSIPSITVPRGATLDSTFTTSSGVGISPTPSSINLALDYGRARILTQSSMNVSAASMTYSYKEVETRFSTVSEQELLFDNKFVTNPTTFSSGPTQPKEQAYPIIFVQFSPGSNSPWCFGGVRKTVAKFRLVVIVDSSYLFDSITELLRDQELRVMPYFTPDVIPFNALGDLKYLTSGNHTFRYNDYFQSCTGISEKIVEISKVRISPFTERVNNEINPKVVAGFIDIDISALRLLT